MRAADERESYAFGAVGDIALCGPTAAMMRAHGQEWPFAKVLPALERADVLFGNLESAVVPDDFPDELVNRRGLVARGAVAPALKHAGFDIVSAANNHILDAGTIGLFHTSRALTDAGVLAGGIGATQQEARQCLAVERNGLRFGFLCYAEDSNYVLSTAGPCHAFYTRDAVLEDIERARPTVDVLVVSVHADLEFTETPSPERRDTFREFARAGATIVLGHHPHVPQGVERIGSSLIAYSLGNFVFHARTSPYMRAHAPATAHSFVLLVHVSRAGVDGFDRMPVVIGAPPEERPALAAGEAAEELNSEFERLDRLVADDAAVARNWRSTAIRHLQTNVPLVADDAADANRLLAHVGRFLYVAENKAWVDEVERAARELWEEQRQQVHEFQRPSLETEAAPRSLRRKLLSALRRVLR